MGKGEASETRAQYWQGQVEAWRVSGQSQLAYCKNNGLSYPRFGYWLRKFRRQGATGTRRASGFVPIVAASEDVGLRMHLPSGIELRGISAQNLHVVEQLLARL